MKSILLTSFILFSTILGTQLEARGHHHCHRSCHSGGFVFVAPAPRPVVYVPVQPSPVVYVPAQPCQYVCTPVVQAAPVVYVPVQRPRPFFNFGFSFLFR